MLKKTLVRLSALIVIALCKLVAGNAAIIRTPGNCGIKEITASEIYKGGVRDLIVGEVGRF